MKVSRLMSTQHPDNVNIPFFAKQSIMDGEDEIKEAFYVFSHLRIDEQLWDIEGKEVDNHVVKKLLSKYPEYFKNSKLGRDQFITFRVPNPDVEKDEGKILIEALHSIPRNFDIGKKFYSDDTPPIFEVMIPMCTSEKALIRVNEYYKNFIHKNQQKTIFAGDITVAEWLGPSMPEEIRVTPLFETKEAMIDADRYVEKYMQFEKIKDFQRVWLARSDPALNYGSLSAVLLNKIAVEKLFALQEKTSIEILPIMGCGTAPFRGNFKPTNAEKMMKGYPTTQTFTVQSAFKYDYPVKDVMDAVEKVKDTKRSRPLIVEMKEAVQIISKVEQEYIQCVTLMADMINLTSKFVPPRRRRKLHIDLFGYARQAGGIKLPRAIGFCAALYSLGLPPEILGLSKLTPQEMDHIRHYYRGFDSDMKDALQYLNKKNLQYFPKEVQKLVLKSINLFEFSQNDEHNAITSEIMQVLKKQDAAVLHDLILSAGKIRQFLG